MTTDDFIRLAPDPKTREAGRRLFYSRRWRLLGGDGRWLWGEFATGGGSKYLKTAVDLTEGSAYCSCRARQRPCAHALALVIILRNDPDRITVGQQPPTWVRSEQFRAERPVAETKDLDAADSRRDARLALMDSGVDELEVRLLDLARRGLADVLARGPEQWLAAAARLTDAKLPGPAGRLRFLASLGPDAGEATVARSLGDLYLFVRAWRKRADLPYDRRRELMSVAGLPIRKEELLAEPVTQDHWLVLGRQEGREDRLRNRRTWLRGERSHRYALLLDFAFGAAPFERSWPPGASFTGGLHYYPGSYAQRALFPSPRPGGKPYEGLRGYATVAELLGNYRRALAVNPWLAQYPAYFTAVRPAVTATEAWVVDEAGHALPLVDDFGESWTLLALSGGQPIALFAEFDGYRLRPLSAVDGTGLVDLSAAPPPSGSPRRR